MYIWHHPPALKLKIVVGFSEGLVVKEEFRERRDDPASDELLWLASGTRPAEVKLPAGLVCSLTGKFATPLEAAGAEARPTPPPTKSPGASDLNGDIGRCDDSLLRLGKSPPAGADETGDDVAVPGRRGCEAFFAGRIG
jgi:hypothetical protein